METRTIDGQLFYVTRAGKREVIQTASEVAAESNLQITQAGTAIATLTREAADIQRQIEDAILGYETTTSLRAKLAGAQAGIDQERRNVQDAEARIQHIQRAEIERHAREISGQHREHVAEALSQFDTRQLKAELNTLSRGIV
jgi:uncharacterized NAD(P)/FAD-binding protein YdhS